MVFEIKLPNVEIPPFLIVNNPRLMQHTLYDAFFLNDHHGSLLSDASQTSYLYVSSIQSSCSTVLVHSFALTWQYSLYTILMLKVWACNAAIWAHQLSQDNMFVCLNVVHEEGRGTCQFLEHHLLLKMRLQYLLNVLTLLFI